jgi:hypothetical protein
MREPLWTSVFKERSAAAVEELSPWKPSHGKDNVERGTHKGPKFEKRRRTECKIKKGIRDRGLKQQLSKKQGSIQQER